MKKQEYPAAFEGFWVAYPKRQGDNPKWKAFLNWQQAIKKIDPQKLVIAAADYADKRAKDVGTSFIPMASTWLFQQRWEVEHPTQGTKDVGKDWDRLCRFFVKTGKWLSRTPEPGYRGCECPVEVLRAHGLVKGS